MRNLKLVLFITTLLTFPFQALAQGWTDPLTVKEVWLQDNLIVVHTSGGAGVYTSGCVSSKYIVVMGTEEARNQAFSLLLTATATGRTVSLWYKDTCVNWNYHQFSAVQLNAT
ncbi:MAG: hypothetical protein COA47_14820 [Robiginitomaculum sp.]|nr:MAG: hypothetical protein COA47_14820 [Robiginitomaculum sp.]